MKVKAFVLLFIFAFISFSYAQVFKVGLYPYDSPSKLYKDFKQLQNYLENKTGYKLEIIMARNYSTHIRNVGEGKVDIAILGPVPYVRVKDKFKNIEAVAKLSFSDNRMNNVVFIANSNSEINKLGDLKGKSFAFGDYNSCGSHYFPRYILQKNSIKLSDFKLYDYLGSHSKVILAVAHGDFDAGGVREDIYRHYANRNVKIIGGPFEIAPHVIVFNVNLNKVAVDKLKSALFSLNDPKILNNLEENFVGFKPVNDSEFDKIRNILQKIEEEH